MPHIVQIFEKDDDEFIIRGVYTVVEKYMSDAGFEPEDNDGDGPIYRKVGVGFKADIDEVLDALAFTGKLVSVSSPSDGRFLLIYTFVMPSLPRSS
ncbi:hypothetical protein HDU86_002861 [Geranomyces michiganensis]|nr:hypothetical protein HDU86_002861 [Geranomyces michiganensis]